MARSDAAFYACTLALAATWAGAGLLSGPIPLRQRPAAGGLGRQVRGSLLVTAAVVLISLAGALLVREIGPLRDYVSDALSHAHQGSIAVIVVVTVANAVAEEVFFRGALFAAVDGAARTGVTTVLYAAAVSAAANPMLIVAALVLGAPLEFQRRLTGGILAPIITHVVWSVTMLFTLAALFPAHH